MCLALLGDKVLLGNLNLILEDISRDIYQLHTVTQGRVDSRNIVCRSDKEHLRQVVLHVEVVVVEGGFLLRVEHLKQCRRRVAVVRYGHLVHLVEDNYRV